MDSNLILAGDINKNITIRNENGEISDLSIDEILPNLEVYAQNELIEVIKSKKRITESVKSQFNFV